jgi:O-acetyl-ADP-ribose deacetylase (regulator of RNase III)
MAEIVDTDNSQIPFLIAAPTMRVPMILSGTVNPYLATRAVLLLIKNGVFSSGMLEGERISDAVKSVAFPGLGTGVGRVSPAICARQLRAAIDQIMLGRNKSPVTWADAQMRHQKLYTDRVRDLQFGD